MAHVTAGYSTATLAKKLGFKDGVTVYASALPPAVRAAIQAGAKPRFTARAAKGLGAAHVFHTSASELRRELKLLRGLLAPDGLIWVSWPKRSAKVETDITEDVVRAVALPMGFVDVKVCAVDETWSGLKLVIRKELRTG